MYVCGGILRSGEGSFVLGFGRGCLLNADGEGGFGWRIKCIGNWNFCVLCSFGLYYMIIYLFFIFNSLEISVIKQILHVHFHCFQEK